MQERLQKIIAQAGICSRRNAELLITGGKVTVNGTLVTELGTKADPIADIIRLEGKIIKPTQNKLYVLLYKPAGYVTTLDDPQGRPIVTSLISGIAERPFPVGRLDYNTEGLLLLTNDGEWANHLAHPRHCIDKEYHVRVKGAVSEPQRKSLADGVELDDGKTSEAQVEIIKFSDNNCWLSIIIHEGKYRQVRRMCEKVGLSVIRLKRVGYGPLTLSGLKPGQWRLLNENEKSALS